MNKEELNYSKMLFDRDERLIKIIYDLQEEKDMYKSSFETMSKNYFEEKSRIDKAIEYIGLNEEDLKLYDIYDVNGIELFKILRGEDNG